MSILPTVTRPCYAFLSPTHNSVQVELCFAYNQSAGNPNYRRNISKCWAQCAQVGKRWGVRSWARSRAHLATC